MNENSNKWIGQNTIRPDGAEKVTGRAAFAADTALPSSVKSMLSVIAGPPESA